VIAARLGEIVAQIKAAARAAAAAGATGAAVTRLIDAALRVSKRARTQTTISTAGISLARAGLDLAQAHLGGLTGRHAFVLGGGSVGRLAARLLHEAEASGGTLRLSVRDDGVGGAGPLRGSGLVGLKDRIEALGGTFAMQSPAGGGTTVSCELPVWPAASSRMRALAGSRWPATPGSVASSGSAAPASLPATRNIGLPAGGVSNSPLATMRRSSAAAMVGYDAVKLAVRGVGGMTVIGGAETDAGRAGAGAGAGALGLPEGVTAGLFDLDGVLTDTAAVHNKAWTEMFDAFLRERAERNGESFVPFDPVADYARYVDGKPRPDGVRDFLASRGITLPEGKSDDGPDVETVNGLGNRKNEALLRRIREEGVEVFEGSRRYLEAARDAGLRRAVVSSSANTAEVLELTGLATLVEGWIDGLTITAEGLKGKPAPDTFLAGARCVGVEPAQAAVFEDALAGVEAGRAGGFGFVVGVDRTGHADALRAHGADIVVRDLAELLDRADGEAAR
jgi:beta-phosphoglucomutase family hydrolase